MLVASWETSKADAVLMQSAAEAGLIPQESIRLRILADSDSPADQALKRRVRDAVIESMNGWVTGPQTLDQARATVAAHLPEIERMAAQMVRDAGFRYDVQVELGMVPFPAKVYGGKLYPAGDYEALRITLGRGLGQNWWCVLFPPLCFVDIASGETPEDEGQEMVAEESPQVEYRFFLVDLIADAVETVRSWWNA